MFFSFVFTDKHLKNLKKHPDTFYKLVNKLSIFSIASIDELITLGKENGLAKITDKNTYKKLNIDTTIIVYKFRLSNKVRCYCSKNFESPDTLNLFFIDINHELN